MIVSNGLENFYRDRTAYNRKPEIEDLERAQRFAVYDDPNLQAQFSHTSNSGITSARLLIGSVSCAACTWLIETSLQRLPSVEAATLNLAQGRLDVSFDLAQLSMSELFEAIATLGYTVAPWHVNTLREQTQADFKTDLRRLAVAAIGMMQVGMFSVALHAGDIQGISAEYQKLLRVVSLLVTSFVVYFSARGFFDSAWRHLRQGALVMDLPVSIAIGGAFSASVLATLSNSGVVYFDSVVMFTFLLLGARFIERRLRYHDSLVVEDAERSLPDAVHCRRGDTWALTPRAQLKESDRLLIRRGDTLPIDGRIDSGSSAVREDSFSGESLPRSVSAGDIVFAGTVNLHASLEITAIGGYADSRLAAVQRSIDTARHKKPAIAQLADRIASRFILAVLILSAATAICWWSIDPSRAFWTALSVLVVSCPCALSLATPSALANATSYLRSRGVLVNGDNALESLPQVKRVLFDKTGTLTTGAFSLEETQALSDALPEAQILNLAASLQRHANHPIASAFAAMPGDTPLSTVDYSVGAGVSAIYAGKPLRMGSLAFCRELCPDLPDPPPTPLYWLCICTQDQPLAWLGISDTLRPETRRLIDRLHARGLRLEMLSGDSSPRAAQLARDLRLDAASTGQSPEDKMAYAQSLQTDAECILMIGDGLNDAPVLKQADVSVAVPGATNLARAQADFVIANGDLQQIEVIFSVAKATRQTIRQNFAWALSYNALAIPLAALGMVPPWAAALGMSLSSIIVVGNAARLRHGIPR